MRVERCNEGCIDGSSAGGGPDTRGRLGGGSLGGASLFRRRYTKLGLKRTTDVLSEKPGKDTKEEAGGSRWFFKVVLKKILLLKKKRHS